jgi:hypothetical protein
MEFLVEVPHFYDVQSKLLSSHYPHITPPLSISYERFNELKEYISKLLHDLVNGLPVAEIECFDVNYVNLLIPVGVSKRPLNIDPLIDWLKTYGYRSRAVNNTEDENGNLITQIDITVMKL